jgi:hypothetical protein
MQFDDKGKNLATHQMSESLSASVANVGVALAAIVDRMEAEMAHEGIISTGSAGALRQLRVRAERLFGASPDESL